VLEKEVRVRCGQALVKAREVPLRPHEFGNLAFIATDQYFIFQFIAFAIEIGVAAYLFKTGPFAWNGLLVYWIPILMYGAWFMTVSLNLLRALRRQSAQAGSHRLGRAEQ
jgi:hypothetical protein